MLQFLLEISAVVVALGLGLVFTRSGATPATGGRRSPRISSGWSSAHRHGYRH